MSTRKRCRAVLLGCVGLFAVVAAQAMAVTLPPGPPPGNSAWVYDAQYQQGHRHGTKAGSFVDALNRYNHGTARDHAITRVYPYGGSMEMYCGDDAADCRPDALKLIFDAHGHQSLAAYSQRLHPVDGQPVRVVPVIDGSIRGNYAGSLKGFNRLSPEMARAFADKVARKMCADPKVSGVQFDLEPFDVKHKNGQYYFYKRIAADFAGCGGGACTADSGKDAPVDPAHDPFGCVDAAHPDGLDFSVFGAAHDLAAHGPAGRHLKQIMTAHHNGFLIVTLYDLSNSPSGHLTPLPAYKKKVQHQIRSAQRGAAALGVPYQLAVPASASGHEYGRCDGAGCRPAPAQLPQLAYLQAAVSAVAASGVQGDPLYLGTAVWAWSRHIGHGGMRFFPSQPAAAALAYLRAYL